MIKWKEKYKWVLIFVAITALVPMLIVSYKVIFTEKNAVTLTFNSNLEILVILYYLLVMLAGIFGFVYWVVKQIKSIVQLKKEKTKAELMHLKAQVNPHFFFNMLNNLYGWVDKDSEKAKELILKLSDMMRYSIYEGQKDWVTLKDEIDFLTNFVELHKMRYHKKIEVDFIVEVADENIKVMPLLFIILLENAFKHGVESLRDNAYVELRLKANEQELFFEVKNNFENQEGNGQGIGLKNLKRRLELVYPNRYKLEVFCKSNVYTAQLTLAKL
ncbi:MAG: two-component system sensor histidine kinase AlgZ [Flavobacteriales bacterium]|jgi:two-component system sensor histidine kinase AlgZ